MVLFKTTDLWFTAYLLTKGASVLRTENSNRGRKVFVCQGDAESLADTSSEYYGGNARVEPKAFRHAVTDVRAMISTRETSVAKEKE